MDADVILEIDFYADWIEFLRAKLTEYGDPPDAFTPNEKIEFEYFNVVKRAIVPKPRQVHLPNGFVVPADLEVDFHKFVEDATSGANLNPYQSRTLKDAEYDDLFLNDWGVHHFHVGRAVEADGFVARRDPLLFAQVTSDGLYVCGFFSHGAWADYDVMETIHANWPTSLERLKLVGIRPVSERPTSEELKKARRAGLMVPLQMLDGTVYMSPGGGISTARLAVDVVSNADRHRDWIRNVEDQVRKELPRVLPQIELALHRKPARLSFRLEFQDGNAFAVDQSAGLALQLGPVPK